MLEATDFGMQQCNHGNLLTEFPTEWRILPKLVHTCRSLLSFDSQTKKTRCAKKASKNSLDSFWIDVIARDPNRSIWSNCALCFYLVLLVDRVCYPIVSWLDLARGPAEANLRLLMIINLPLNLAKGREGGNF